MTDLSLAATVQVTRTRRYIIFRILVAMIAALLLVGFGVWLSILTPWLLIGDDTDHGWSRAPELHRLADSASAALMAALGAAAIVLAIRPKANSGITAWLLGMLALIGLSSLGSSAVQGHELAGAAVSLPIWLALAVGLPWLFAPSRATLVTGGARSDKSPGRAALIAFAVEVAAGSALAIGAIIWRLSGGVIENPREDDVFGFALLGVAVAVGGIQCLRAREGWRTLGTILTVLVLYSAAAVTSLAVAGSL